MKKINHILRKCKTLSKQLSSKSIGSKSARHHDDSGIMWNTNAISVCDSNSNSNSNSNSKVDSNESEDEQQELVFVGSTRKRYVISSKYLSNPVVNALLEKSKASGNDVDDVSVINCEVVLFDHLLWMLENGDFNGGSECFDELADMYSS